LSRLIIGLTLYIVRLGLAQAEILTGRVVKIPDGDTITVLDRFNRQHKIRLVGIDAPERKQSFHTVFRQNLANPVFEKKLRWSGISGTVISVFWEKYLWTARTQNLEQLKEGLAWHYKQYGKSQQFAENPLCGGEENCAI
jgi:endonuclease YncB( thermonuclease family)